MLLALAMLLFSISGYAQPTPPSAPTNVTVTPVNAGTVYVSWSGSTDFSGKGLLKYQITTTSSSVLYGLRNVTPAKTLAAVVGLAANKSYEFSVKAYDNADGVSVASAPVTGDEFFRS